MKTNLFPFLNAEDKMSFTLTKKLAKELNLIETLHVKKNHRTQGPKQQLFQFLIVIDFESTCWKEKNGNMPEIIEFPAVLLNLNTGVIEGEFQQYVMPTENPILSAFCTELTGIKQDDVESGVPIKTCLSLFNDWIKQISGERRLVFHKNEVDGVQNVCTFVTWSDWDLSFCLHNECARKQIYKPDILCQWIDLRATYREFYKRRPQGLRGALSELGIVFQGREHSGLCDAKNTALLAWRMVKDGVILKVTKSLESNKKPSVISTKHLLPNKLQYKGDTVQNGVHQTPRQPLKILNIATPQRRNSIHGDASPLPGTPINLKKSQSLRRALLNKCIQNCNKDSARIVTSPIIVSKCLNTTKNESVGNISKNNLKTPNTAVRPAPSSSCKRTPPLCKCGCRATRKLVSLPGPNQGRNFFTCSKRKSLGMVQTSGCGFFRWEN